jgi:hypothetical protein
LKELFWENRISKFHFAFIQILCKLICKRNISKMIYKSCITEKVFEKDFQILFYKVFTLIAKELIWKP